MANNYIPRPHARFHAWQNNFVTYVNGHPAHLGHDAAGALGAQIWGRLAWASRPRTCDQPPPDPGEAAFLERTSRAPPRPSSPARTVGRPRITWYDGSAPAAKSAHLPLTGRRDKARRHVKGGAKRPARRLGRSRARESRACARHSEEVARGPRRPEPCRRRPTCGRRRAHDRGGAL